MKLGRFRSPFDARDKRLAAYAPSVTAPPLASDWTRLPTDHSMIAFPDFGNLKIGDCTCAALGHGERAAALINGAKPQVDLDLVYTAYEAISKWRRDDPTTNDDGASNRDALSFFRKRGLIEAYVRLLVSNQHLKFAIAHGGAYVGADLPKAAAKQLDAGQPWDVPKHGERWDSTYTRRSWGGHAMMALTYDRHFVTFVTWGQLQKASWEWVLTYVDEAWFPIFDVWTQTGKLTASGFDVDRLYREVRGLTS